MNTWQLLLTTWTWDPSVIAGSLAVIVVYLATVHFRFNWQTVLFIGGVLVLFFALESPLEALGDTYLFSAHMLQHLLLILLVPPLLLLGMPRWLAELILDWPFARAVESKLGRPVVAWLVGVVTLWIWHLPLLYNATLLNESIHILEHLSFLITATIFWWPVFHPLAEQRAAPLTTIIYLFAAAASSSALGIILTFAPAGLYPAYLQPFDTLGILSLLRHEWGLTPAVDQQIGGLLMWVPGSLVYLTGIVGALARWYGQSDGDRETAYAG
jgi:cytochrome c oxidase assembly factor CtaG